MNDVETGLLRPLQPLAVRCLLDVVIGPIPSILRLKNVKLVVNPLSDRKMASVGAHTPREHRVQTVQTDNDKWVAAVNLALIEHNLLDGACGHVVVDIVAEKLDVVRLHLLRNLSLVTEAEPTNEHCKCLEDFLQRISRPIDKLEHAESVLIDVGEGGVAQILPNKGVCTVDHKLVQVPALEGADEVDLCAEKRRWRVQFDGERGGVSTDDERCLVALEAVAAPLGRIRTRHDRPLVLWNEAVIIALYVGRGSAAQFVVLVIFGGDAKPLHQIRNSLRRLVLALEDDGVRLLLVDLLRGKFRLDKSESGANKL
eukprot:Opistho-2@86572